MPVSSVFSDFAGEIFNGVFQVIPHSGMPGLFKICYCNSSVMGFCDMDSSFAQYAGELDVTLDDGSNLAPLDDLYMCGAGRQCSLVIDGTWAMQVQYTDAFFAVPEEALCGEGRSYVSGTFTFDRRDPLINGTQQAFFSLASDHMFPAGNYNLCYCPSQLVPNWKCEHESQFIIHSGQLRVVGAQSVRTWACLQGDDCDVTVPIWHASAIDALRVVVADLCVDAAGHASQPAVGFMRNPSTNPHLVSTEQASFQATFTLGQALGAGTWHVCLCISSLSFGGNCSHEEDFQQYVGDVVVTGPVLSVSPLPSLPATLSFVSAVVDLAFAGTLTCAASDRPFVRDGALPSNFDISACDEQMPGCVGTESINRPLPSGLFVIHVPVHFNESVRSGAITANAHMWCMARQSCYTGLCVEPPIAEGVVQPVRQGVAPWTEWTMVRHAPFDFVLNGDPVNPLGELRIVPEDAFCEDQRRSIFGGVAPEKNQSVAVVWPAVQAEDVGRYSACWCDRFDGSRCPAWQIVGLVLVVGPTGTATTLPPMDAGQLFDVQLQGVGLSADDRLVAVPFAEGDCSNALLSNSTIPTWTNGTVARWTVKAPWQYGEFALCWGRDSVLKTLVGAGFVQEHRDCNVSNWTAADDTRCNRQCGGGFYEERRVIYTLAVGNGEPCPPVEELGRQIPCNTQPCPEALVNTSVTQPRTIYAGAPFKVIISGSHLRPAEDRLLLLPQGAHCGASNAAHEGGAACNRYGGSSARLVCGDGLHSLKVEAVGVYRICMCAADEYVGYGSQNCSGGSEAYTFSPRQGSLIEVLESRGTGDGGGQGLSLPDGDGGHTGDDPGSGGGGHGGADDGDGAVTDIGMGTEPPPLPVSLPGPTLYPVPEEMPATRVKATQAHEKHIFYNPLAMGGFAALAVPLCVAMYALPSWCRRFRRRRVRRQIADAPFVVKEEDVEDIVTKTTQQMWDAYARTLTQHIYGMDAVEEEPTEHSEQAADAGKPATVADDPQRPDSGHTGSTAVSSRPVSRQSVISGASREDAQATAGMDGRPPTPGWGTPKLGDSGATPPGATPLASRPGTSRTQPRTPVFSRPGTARTATSRPATNASASTNASKYSSFLRMDISGPSTPVRALTAGGAFTQVPLMGSQPQQADVAAVAAAAVSTEEYVVEPAKPLCTQFGVSLKASTTPPKLLPALRHGDAFNRPSVPPLLLPPPTAMQQTQATPAAAAASDAHTDEVVRLVAKKLEALVAATPVSGLPCDHATSTARPPGDAFMPLEAVCLPPHVLQNSEPRQPERLGYGVAGGTGPLAPVAAAVEAPGESPPLLPSPVAPDCAVMDLPAEPPPAPRVRTPPPRPATRSEEHPEYLAAAPACTARQLLELPPPPTPLALGKLPPTPPQFPKPLVVSEVEPAAVTSKQNPLVRLPVSLADRPPFQNSSASTRIAGDVAPGLVPPPPPPPSGPMTKMQAPVALAADTEGPRPPSYEIRAVLEADADDEETMFSVDGKPSQPSPRVHGRQDRQRVAAPSLLGRLSVFVAGSWWSRRASTCAPAPPPRPAAEEPAMPLEPLMVSQQLCEAPESFEASIARLLNGAPSLNLPGAPVDEPPVPPALPSQREYSLDGLDTSCPARTENESMDRLRLCASSHSGTATAFIVPEVADELLQPQVEAEPLESASPRPPESQVVAGPSQAARVTPAAPPSERPVLPLPGDQPALMPPLLHRRQPLAPLAIPQQNSIPGVAEQSLHEFSSPAGSREPPPAGSSYLEVPKQKKRRKTRRSRHTTGAVADVEPAEEPLTSAVGDAPTQPVFVEAHSTAWPAPPNSDAGSRQGSKGPAGQAARTTEAMRLPHVLPIAEVPTNHCENADGQSRCEAEWYARLAANPHQLGSTLPSSSQRRKGLGSLRGAAGTGAPPHHETPVSASTGESWRRARSARPEEGSCPSFPPQQVGAVGAGLLTSISTSAWTLPVQMPGTMPLHGAMPLQGVQGPQPSGGGRPGSDLHAP